MDTYLHSRRLEQRSDQKDNRTVFYGICYLFTNKKYGDSNLTNNMSLSIGLVKDNEPVKDSLRDLVTFYDEHT